MSTDSERPLVFGGDASRYDRNRPALNTAAGLLVTVIPWGQRLRE
jgi:hypothetical protein